MLMRKAIFLRCLTAYYYRTEYLTKSIVKIIYFGLNVYFSGAVLAQLLPGGTHLLIGTPGVLLFSASILFKLNAYVSPQRLISLAILSYKHGFNIDTNMACH